MSRKILQWLRGSTVDFCQVYGIGSSDGREVEVASELVLSKIVYVVDLLFARGLNLAFGVWSVLHKSNLQTHDLALVG